MAIRFLQPKLLHNARSFTRPLSSASSSLTSVSPLNFAEKPNPTIEKHDPCSSTLNIHDHQKLFRTISSAKLLRSWLNLNIAAVGPVVDLGLWVMNSRLMDIDISREIITGLVRHTFYEHFCAGESAAEAERCIEKINETGLRGMLFYSVEHTDDKNECDKNLRGFLQTAESAKSLDPSAVRFSFFFQFQHIYIYIVIIFSFFEFLIINDYPINPRKISGNLSQLGYLLRRQTAVRELKKQTDFFLSSPAKKSKETARH